MVSGKTEAQMEPPQHKDSAPNGHLPNAAQIYVWSVIVLSLPVLALSVYRSVSEGPGWVYLAGLTVLASLFSVRIPLLNLKSGSLTISVNDAFVFVAILLFSPEVAALIAAIEGFTASLRYRVQKTYKKIFNIGVLTLVTFAVGRLLLAVKRGLSLPADQTSFLQLLAIVLGAGIIYFLLNSLLVAFAISLASGNSLLEIWRRNFALLWWANLVNEATAAIIFFYFRPANLGVLLLGIPLALVVLSSRRISLSRTSQPRTA